MELLIINGASGSGKTTLAEALAASCPGLTWVHPDGLMETVAMEAEAILERSLAWASALAPESWTVVDCQIRPTAIGAIAARHGSHRWQTVLLDCPAEVREQRLLDRGWTGEDFRRIHRWAGILRRESLSRGDRVVDTSMASVDSVTGEIRAMLSL